MKKYNKYFIVSLLVVFSLVMTGMADAASTIGTNMSTTGTFTQTVGSATAAQFQNAAGTLTALHVDTTNIRVGVGAAPSTKFEVQGTASASYFFTLNTLQVAGVAATVAYSRFGVGTTGYTAELDAANDLLITGALEVDGKSFFDGTASVASNFEVGGTASISGIVNLANGQVRPQTNSATAFRFQNAAGTVSVLTIDTTSGLYGRVGVGKTPSTIFDVKGTASAAHGFLSGSLQVAGTTGASQAYSRFGTGTTGYSGDVDAANDLLITGALEVDGNTFLDGKASISGNFQTSGRLIGGNASHSFTGDLRVSSNFIVGATTASSSGGLYTAEFGGDNTGTVSLLFGGDSSSKGTCLQLKNTQGEWVYLRIKGTASSTLDITTIRCQ